MLHPSRFQSLAVVCGGRGRLQLRPWKVARDLSDPEFKQQLLGWGLPALLFEQKQTWALFEPKLRREMAQFDEYQFDDDEPPLPCPVAAFLSQECPKVRPAVSVSDRLSGCVVACL